MTGACWHLWARRAAGIEPVVAFRGDLSAQPLPHLSRGTPQEPVPPDILQPNPAKRTVDKDMARAR
jgi:hypothetical protein